MAQQGETSSSLDEALEAIKRAREIAVASADGRAAQIEEIAQIVDDLPVDESFWSTESEQEPVVSPTVRQLGIVLLRLSLDLPEQGLRTLCRVCLAKLRTKGIPVPRLRFRSPSMFIPLKYFTMMDDPDDSLRAIMEEILAKDHKISNIYRVIGMHPGFLQVYQRAIQIVMWGDTGLYIRDRFLIGILAASRHKCKYLVDLLRYEYLAHGGASEYLQGAEFLPEKYARLLPLNSLLAHRPWDIKAAQIQALLGVGPDLWSRTDLVHAMLILTHFHSLSGVVFGCGIAQEPELEGAFTWVFPQKASEPSTPTEFESASTPATTLTTSSSSDSLHNLADLLRAQSDASDDEGAPNVARNVQDFFQVDAIDAEISDQTPQADRFPYSSYPAKGSLFATQDVADQHEDFVLRGDRRDTALNLATYNWTDHGFPLVQRHLGEELADAVDKRFTFIQAMSYGTVGSVQMDSSPFRTGIWNCVLRLKGILNPEYNYRKLKLLVHPPAEFFVKFVTCYPELVSQDIYNRLNLLGIEESEKVHVTLLATEARCMAALLMGLNALSQSS
eukprot:m.183536 g.183536  ORF g.183536 m.183536 type:complete len:559 (+) comp53501_c0_seq1:195-1871(+)